MIIKKRTLYIWIPIIIVSLIVALVAYNSYTEKRNKELQMQDYLESYEREVDREYRRLVDRMDSDAKSAMDYEYSSSFRRKEIRRINELFKRRFYFSPDPYEFEREYRSKREEALKALKSVAASNVLDKYSRY